MTNKRQIDPNVVRSTEMVAYNIWLVALFLLSTTVVILPFILNGKLYMGSDLQFHLNRIQELKSAFESKGGFPFISTETFNNVTVPLNLLYSPMTLLPIVFVTLLVTNPVTAIYIGIGLILFVSLVLNYIVAKRFFKQDVRRALLFTYAYTFSSIAFSVQFSGFTFGQTLASVFYPMVMYGFYSIFSTEKSAWVWLALGLSAIVYSYSVSVLIIVVLLAILLIIVFIVDPREAVLNAKTFLLSIGLTIGLSAFYIISYVYIEANNSLVNTKTFNLADSALPVGTLLIQSLLNSYSTGIGVLFLITIVISVIRYKHMSRIIKINFWLAVALVLMSTNLFPWSLFQNTPLVSIQFPYRILSIASVPLSCLFVDMIISLISIFKKWSVMIVMVTITAILVGYGFNTYQFILSHNAENELRYTPTSWHNLPQEPVYVTASSYNNLLGYTTGVGSSDYWPQKSIKYVYDIINSVFLVDGERTYDAQLKTAVNRVEYTVSGESKHPKIDLPILDYGFYSVTVDGEPRAYQESKRGTVEVVGNHGLNTIVITATLPNIIKSGIYISLLSGVMVIGGWMWRVVTVWNVRKRDDR